MEAGVRVYVLHLRVACSVLRLVLLCECGVVDGKDKVWKGKKGRERDGKKKGELTQTQRTKGGKWKKKFRGLCKFRVNSWPIFNFYC